MERTRNHLIKLLAVAAVILCFCIICIGYAELNDNLEVSGDIGYAYAPAVISPKALRDNAQSAISNAKTIVLDNFSTRIEDMAENSIGGKTWLQGTPVSDDVNGIPGGVRVFTSGDIAYILAYDNFKMVFPADCGAMFGSGYQGGVSVSALATNATKIIFGENIDTSKVTAMGGMFQNCSNLESIDFVNEITDQGNFDTSNVTDMGSMFYGCSRLKTVKFGDKFNTGKVADMANMFRQVGFTSLNLSGFNTEKVTNMKSMFQDCPNLVTLNLSDFNTGAVNSMQSMFNGCGKLETLSVGTSFDGKSVTGSGLSEMFNNCSVLKELNMSGFSSGSATTTISMFQNCRALTSVTLGKDFTVSNVTDMTQMFVNCESLTTLKAANASDNTLPFNPTAVVNTKRMFDNCKSLVTLNMPNFTGMSIGSNGWGMFQNCANLKTVKLPAFNTSSTANIGSMFANSAALEVLDLRSLVDNNGITKFDANYFPRSVKELYLNSFKGSAITTGTLEDAFSLYNSLEILHLDSYVGSTITSAAKAFNGKTTLKEVYLNSFNGNGNIATTAQMFFGCRALTTVNLSGFDTSKVTMMWSMFQDCNELTTITVGDKFATTSAQSMSNMFKNCNKLPTDSLANLVSKFNTSKATSMDGMFYGCRAVTSLNLSNFDTKLVKTMKEMFRECTGLGKSNGTLNLSGFTTSSVTDMSYMFNNCNQLTALDLSGFNSAALTNMSYMFQDCSNLDQLTFGANFTASSVTNMGFLFQNCAKLGASNSNTFTWNFVGAKVEDADRMFSNCSGLTKIYLPNFTGESISNTSLNNGGGTGLLNMVNGCAKLIEFRMPSFTGGELTKANLQGGIHNDFVQILDLSGLVGNNVANLADMFRDHIYLQELYLTNYVGAGVTSVASMFQGCTNLKTVNMSSFTGQSVTAAQAMFKNCPNLGNSGTLSLQSFNSAALLNTNEMFSGCSHLTSLTLGSNFACGKVTNMSYMFTNCGLTSLNWSSLTGASATNVAGMFQNCSSLGTLVLQNFSSAVTDMHDMFRGCSSLVTLNLSNFNTKNIPSVDKMQNTFMGCDLLEEITLSANFKFAGDVNCGLPGNTGQYGKWRIKGSSNVYDNIAALITNQRNASSGSTTYSRPKI